MPNLFATMLLRTRERARRQDITQLNDRLLADIGMIRTDMPSGHIIRRRA